MITLIHRLNLPALFKRVKLTTTQPTTCWNTLVSEESTPRDLIGELLLPLLLVGALCSVIGRQLFGVYEVKFLDTWYPPLFEDTIVQLVQAIFALGVNFLGAIALKILAPHFGGRNDMNRAFSLLAHASIPMLLAGILTLIPVIHNVLVVFFICYSIYLFYQGGLTMLDIPVEQRLGFVGAAIGVMILISVIGIFLAAFIAPSTPPGTLSI